MSAYARQSTWTDGVGGTPVSAARLNAMEVGIVNAARGVLARGTYNAADQPITVAAGQVAMTGATLAATVAASRYSSLNVSLAYAAAGVGEFRVTHQWNGVTQYLENVPTWTGWVVHHFKTPPFGLTPGTFNYSVQIQCFTNNVTIGNSSFVAAYMWVEDLGGT